MARLVVCCDGTWNTPEQEDNGLPSATNVVKLHGAIAEGRFDGVTQDRPYYRSGVGSTGTLWQRLKGGALGVGLDDDVKSAYRWLCDNYSEGDEIFLFGFSRGAFTVRSLAGLIGRCKLLKFVPEDGEKRRWTQVDNAYNAYRKKSATTWETDFPRNMQVKIRFLGVWDTVGSLGIPDELLLNFLNKRGSVMFHDTGLGRDVEIARHAVAIDEKRQTFAPTLWSECDHDCDVKQWWFTGVHGDLGGSYADRGLGDISLKWMMEEAQAAGLVFREGVFDQLAPDPKGIQHNSVKGIFKHFRTRPRRVPHFDDDVAPYDSNQRVYDTARKRREDPPLAQPAYWATRSLAAGEKAVIRVSAKERWNDTGLYLRAGETYDLHADGEWLDYEVVCDPDGPKEALGFGQIVQSTLSGPSNWWQRRRRRKAGYQTAVVHGAKRAQDLPFFCLVGMVANGSGVDIDSQRLHPHQMFRIGRSAHLTPQNDGHFYCFANDVWRFYSNNKGSVALTVTRKE